MRLQDDLLPSYVRLFHPDVSVTKHNERLAIMRAEVAKGERDLEDAFVVVEGGDIVASCRLRVLGPPNYQLTRLKRHKDAQISDAAYNALAREVIERSGELGARSVGLREITSELEEGWRDALLQAGFYFTEERIEFKSPVESLPEASDEASPLVWRSMAEVGRELGARMLDRVSEETAFGLKPGETGAEAIVDYFNDPELTSGDDCVHIGFLDDAPVAFLCVQVEKDGSGWSRITFMGLTPEARGKRLGTWVHRHGFAMIRAQKGTLYHGGTAMENVAMRRLFVSNGCKEAWRLSEFDWKRDA